MYIPKAVRLLKWIIWDCTRLSKHIANISSTSRLHLWLDTSLFTLQYRISPYLYANWDLWKFDRSERNQKIPQLLIEYTNSKRWWDDYSDNRKFLSKYNEYKWEASVRKRNKRNNAYRKKYNAGEGLYVQYNVDICREHELGGEIVIGKNVLLAKNVFIDYSGGVVIGNDVQITNGVIIETHHHPFHSNYSENRSIVEPSKLLISEGAVLGSRSIILSSCNYIGKYARVGAGAVVTHDIPDYAIVAGVPARVIRLTN